jgi:hypothetical protein
VIIRIESDDPAAECGLFGFLRDFHRRHRSAVVGAAVEPGVSLGIREREMPLALRNGAGEMG